MKLHTVNVVEYDDDELLGIHTFSDDEAGNEEAKAHFRQCAIEVGATEAEADEFVDDGYYENNTYQLFLKHSDPFGAEESAQ